MTLTTSSCIIYGGYYSGIDWAVVSAVYNDTTAESIGLDRLIMPARSFKCIFVAAATVLLIGFYKMLIDIT